MFRHLVNTWIYAIIAGIYGAPSRLNNHSVVGFLSCLFPNCIQQVLFPLPRGIQQQFRKENMTVANLVLEDGTLLQGNPFGAATDAVFELVFNTSMTGYQEILTDPSYRGQAVVFTVAHIGNVGINREDSESQHLQVSAAVVRSLSPVVSNWRAETTLPEWLAQQGVPGICEVDTRYLTRKLRSQGTLKAALSTQGTPPRETA